MPNVSITDKGFKVIFTSNVDVIKIGGFGICDRCDVPKPNGVIIPVLAGRWYCDSCFEDWHKNAEKFEEDIAYEESTFARFTNLLNI